MSSNYNFFVMQVLRGSTIAHGPFRTKSGRDNAMDRIQGGEIYPFDTITDDPEQAIREFNSVGV